MPGGVLLRRHHGRRQVSLRRWSWVRADRCLLLAPRVTAGYARLYGHVRILSSVSMTAPPPLRGRLDVSAAATRRRFLSTGGTMNKLAGRVGDSPLIGAGTYADDEAGAVSTTGHGEGMIRI